MQQQPTKEMLEYFEKRTKYHINLVNEFGKAVKKKFSSFGIVPFPNHDLNKYDEPLKTPYVFLTWKYHVPSFEYPAGMEEKVNEATLQHVLSNQHHPEFWDKEHAKINEKDRDKPSGILIDATNMVSMRLAEMVCDWSAVGWEKDKSSPRNWAKKNVNIRWKFTPGQVAYIYKMIDAIEDIIAEKPSFLEDSVND